MTLKPSHLGVTSQNYLGRSQYADPYLNSAVDEFRIYHGALTAGEVASLVTPLAAPTGLVATPGEAQVALAWNPVVNTVSYQVSRATAAAGPYAPVMVLAGTVFTDTDLVNGTNYFYVVKAANGAGLGAATAPVAARPFSLAPVALGGQATDAGLALNWPADHTGWRLLVQTNTLAVDWLLVPGSTATNWMVLPFDPAVGAVFYRLARP
jgi:hypothetical protein